MKRSSPTVNRVLRGELCSGCGLCASLTSGEMIVVEPGYNRPVIGTNDPATELLIASACPGAVVSPWSSAVVVHPYWGPYRDIRTGHATDPRVRHRGSSGGFLSALLAYALEVGLVDAALEIGPDPDNPTRNCLLLSRSMDEILAGAGSRYAPSSPLEFVTELLTKGERIAFVGKPCDVSALRLLGMSDERVARTFPIVLSFFCAGIPSLAGSGRVLQSMGVDAADVAAFRYRGEGWPGFATAVRHDGTEARMSYEQSWGGHLSKQVQFRCKICPDAVGGSADLVCADAWYGGESGYPTFDELPGRSLVITRTPAGTSLLERALAAGAVEISSEPLPADEIDLMQPSQARRKRLVRARVAALRATARPATQMRGLSVEEASRRATWTEQLRDFLGMLRRIVQRRL